MSGAMTRSHVWDSDNQTMIKNNERNTILQARVCQVLGNAIFAFMSIPNIKRIYTKMSVGVSIK